MTRPLGVPQPGRAAFSTESSETSPSNLNSQVSVKRGQVFSEFHVRRPFGTNRFESTVRLYEGSPRIDFTTRLLNNEKFVRYRLLVPAAITNGHNVHEIPFGAIERPLAQEFPAQNWIDCGDSQHGIALLNRGLPGNNVAEGTLMLSLLRSTRIQSYGIGGGFEGQSSDSGLELGQERVFHYALLPHSGDWREAGISQAGMEFNHPLLVRKAAPHPGPLPKQWGLLEISPAGVVLTALKPGADRSVILRVYESHGQPAPNARIKFLAKIRSAHDCNLMEDSGPSLKLASDTLQFDLHAFEIKTFKLRLKESKIAN